MQLPPLSPQSNLSPSPRQPSTRATTTTTDNDTVSTQAPGDKQADVQLSAEGLARLHAEQAETEQAGGDDNKSPEIAKIDQLIEQLQKQIQELQTQLKALAGDDSEGAKQQREALRAQLTQLMGGLQEAFNRKMKLLEEGFAG